MLANSSSEARRLPTDGEAALLQYARASSLDSIRSLSLANFNLDDKTVNYALLSKLKALRALDLSGNRLTRFTVHLPSLEKLILTGNCIASIDDVDIHGLPKLQSLALINNEDLTLRDAPYQSLKSVLPNLVEYNGKRWETGFEETCIVCGEPQPDDQMLACDGCDEYYHIRTCAPKVQQMPADEEPFYCDACERAPSGGAAAGRDHAADVDRLRARLSLVQMLRIHGPYPSLEHNKQQVWACEFMPPPTTQYHGVAGDAVLLATCGGNAVCVTSIEGSAGKVMHKFVHDGDDFATIAWAKLPMQDSNAQVPVLLAGGDAGILHMYRPDIKCFGTVQGHKGSMDFIAVHPTRTDWVLTAGKKSATLWELGGHNKDGPVGNPARKLCQWSVESPINCVAFVPMEEFADDEEMFFMVGPAGHISSRRIPLCNNGINDKLAHDDKNLHLYSGEGFYSLNNPKDDDSAMDHSIDQILHIKDHIVATKSANDARILLWDYNLASKPRNILSKKHIQGVLNHTCEKLYQLHGCLSPDGTALICGDAYGNIKVFDLTKVRGIEPSFPVQMWSSVHSECATAIRNVSMSPDSRYVAAVNQSNLVLLFCIG